MANAAIDPYWKAKVNAEVQAHPSFKNIIEDKCNTCHAPMGRTEAIFKGQEYYSLDEALNDALSLDGVSCTVCHQIDASNLGENTSFSGGYSITDVHMIYGPYLNPFTNPMINTVNYTPEYAEHLTESGLCATCHTLFTPYLDDDMNVAGYFPEQTPFLEWLNSDYEKNGQSCQSCHMPRIGEAMKISTLPPNLSNVRSEVWEHEFVGANVFMLNILKNNIDELGLNATSAEFDSTIFRTENKLGSAVEMSTEYYEEEGNLIFRMTIENLTGHKFPTGFPSRRAWLHFKLYDHSGFVVFESGEYDTSGKILDKDIGYEKHYQEITDDNQVQIYQALMQDVNNELTYTLLRGASYIKDNRLLPKGYIYRDETDSATAPSGLVMVDPDFNLEGSGADILYYRIPVTGTKGDYTYDLNSGFEFSIDFCYQSATPEFIEDIGKYETALIGKFMDQYDRTSNQPVIIKRVIENVVDHSKENIFIRNLHVYPNPVREFLEIDLNLEQECTLGICLFAMDGSEITELERNRYPAGNQHLSFQLKDYRMRSGEYILVISDGKDRTSRKILVIGN